MVVLFGNENNSYTEIVSLVGVGVGEIAEWNIRKL